MFTTSRYASESTRELARRMAKKNNEVFISRGKHTIAQLAGIARRKGEERISIIEEQGKKPSLLATITIMETGEWRWAGQRPIDKDKNAG